ncbi:MAG: CatB-related O-acetyltransferase [Paeniclostridium sordellii]|uniref:CatB-related O-acetyltransferase n=1 Tax=Paeniclostridium hominis TaxID=2764329 RepID=A0ABR7K3Z7_9FIRM|nr:CatB-related O-acetyltransferase [Paeniclostridium hominis]MDU2592373.1 CatB-related O-acetyltransferase [Paeniclostridium sordellii]
MNEVVKRLVFYILRKKMELGKSVSIGKKTRVNFKTVVEGGNRIGENNIISNSYIGYGTYTGRNNNLASMRIGKYCSIASNINLIMGTHPTKIFVSTHPAFFSLKKQAGFTYVEKQLFDESNNENKAFKVIIGNDVWIGDNVSLISGVKIGNGAIIGANSLVTKDCKPYYIYGGVPAKKIGQRFTDEQITILNELKWWDRSEEWIIDNIDKFSNIDEFIKEQLNG